MSTEQTMLTASANCPICGYDQPHGHKDTSVMWFRDHLQNFMEKWEKHFRRYAPHGFSENGIGQYYLHRWDIRNFVKTGCELCLHFGDDYMQLAWRAYQEGVEKQLLSAQPASEQSIATASDEPTKKSE